MVLTTGFRHWIFLASLLIAIVALAFTTLVFLPVLLTVVLAALVYGPLVSVAISLLLLVYSDGLVLSWEQVISIVLVGLLIGGLERAKRTLRRTNLQKIISLNRRLNEFTVLRELNRTMQSTFDLGKIVRAILTGATAGKGLGFNRALLFLVRQGEQALAGEFAVGPDSQEEAFHIWESIALNSMDEILQSNIGDRHLHSNQSLKQRDSKLRQKVLATLIDLKEDTLLTKVVREPKVYHLRSPQESPAPYDSVLIDLKAKELAVAPLQLFDEVIGVVVVDNPFNQAPIREQDLSALGELANQAAIAIGNAQSYQKLTELAVTDGLTNLYNHRYFQERFSDAILEREDLKTPLSLAIFDIDWFKVYNDTYGHKAGDKALAELARLLLNETRSDDVVCRYGGEEFAVLLRDTSFKQALRVTERIRRAIAQHRFPGEESQPTGTLTCSVGVATAPQHGSTCEVLFGAADRALYQAKQGRNQVCGACEERIS